MAAWVLNRMAVLLWFHVDAVRVLLNSARAIPGLEAGDFPLLGQVAAGSVEIAEKHAPGSDPRERVVGGAEDLHPIAVDLLGGIGDHQLECVSRGIVGIDPA